MILYDKILHSRHEIDDNAMSAVPLGIHDACINNKQTNKSI